MDPNMNMHRNGLERMDLSQFQGDANKLNSSVLRGIEGNTLHFITIPRNTENEYIDHALLSPDYIAAHIQNGLVVDIIQQPHDQQAAIPSHNIYNSVAIEQNASPLEMTTERHFIANNENVQIPMENIHHSMHPSHSSMSAEHLNHRNHFESNSNIEEGRKVIIEEHGRQYILTNEAPVIVSNKEATAMAMNLDLSHSFQNVNTFSQMDQTVLQDITKTNTDRMNSDLDEKIQANALPPLPPLTPISKLQAMRKTSIEQHQEQVMQYKSAAHSSASMNLPKNNTILKNVCFVTDDDDVDFVQSNMKLINRQSIKEQSQSIGPKKNLPHKKRITKKLKSISPSVDQMQAVDSMYHMHHDMANLQRQSHHDQSYSVSSHQQNETLNLTLNQQPIQLTTPRVNQAVNQTDYIQSDHFANAADATSSIHSVQLQQMPISEAQPTIQAARYSCEICGMHVQSQLAFFNHLKLHYEPETVPNQQNCDKMETIRNATALALEQNDQNMFQMNDERKMSSNQCISSQPMAAPVIMNDNFVRLQNNEQDFSCISGIGNEDVTDDESINGGIKSEQNEFSDTEDMLENGVLDKVQRVVDSYIENGTSDVKNLIDMNENQHHSSLVDNSCGWTASNNSHNLSNNTVYTMGKTGNMNEASNFVITSNNQGKGTIQTTPNQIINNQPVIERPEELTLIYEINEDFPTMDDTSTESILRRQLVRQENTVNTTNQNQFDQNEVKPSVISMERDMSTFMTESSESTGSTASKVNIQDEFIEEEQTDSDVDPSKLDAQKKKKKIYRCKRCNKLCNSKNALHYHFLSHTGERPHQCNECGKSFFASSALKVHKRLHSGDKPYNCEFCNRPFRQWGDLKYHIQSKHTKEKSHQCEFCGKDFARRYSLVIHRRIHTGEKNYKCEFCDKEFRASSYLQVHRKIHTGEKPFVCDVCGKRFRVRGDLKRHSNIHERNKTIVAKIEDLSCMSGGSSSGKNEIFIMDDNNQSRSADTLDQLVSVIEYTDATLATDSGEDDKKRVFMEIEYDKAFTKAKHKRDLKTTNTADDCSSAILDYSTDHLMVKNSLNFDNVNEKSRIRHH
ncbi:uncharacterized protein LOC129565422 [Sitodiplosis mosellana]|uniref:uncharacterized protein LOC129565422 n=1 Tax=Sitodiplosis mosellana TaxID=263140 RepID=UPI002443D1C1|nr:uncharacterized protein LOC129565422 [Sitodiplosis mosellana]XP_055296304.1 uncharacterized protein LOC129565422 [Sitodiplosis mosellana]